MALINKRKTREFYFNHFDEDDTDFEHMYEILTNIEKDVLSYDKKDLRKHGLQFAKAPVEEVRKEWAEDNLVELTPKQAEFICTMGVIIISRRIMILGSTYLPPKKDEE